MKIAVLLGIKNTAYNNNDGARESLIENVKGRRVQAVYVCVTSTRKTVPCI